MKFEIVNVTKDMAKHWLETSKGNPRWEGRVVDQERVNYYANKMNLGYWQLSPEPISFDVDGHLIDGHHRLTALLISNLESLKMSIANDCECNIFDDNMKRSTSSLSRTLGSPLSNAEIALTRFAIGCLEGRYYRFRSVPVEECCDFAKKNPEINTACLLGSSASIKSAPFTMCMFAALKCGVPLEKLQRFCQVARTGLPKDETEYSAVKCVQHIKSLGHINQELYFDACGFVEYYLNSFIDGVVVKKTTKSGKHYYLAGWVKQAMKSKFADNPVTNIVDYDQRSLYEIIYSRRKQRNK